MNLIILGNGFDIAHGLITRYSDFRSFLVACGQKESQADSKSYKLVEILDDLFDFGENWQDFEIGLGRVKADGLSALLSYGLNGIEDTIAGDLQSAFAKWVISISAGKATPIFKLDYDDKYFMFNYTHTLEEIYGVSDNRIKYIHGCAGVGCYISEVIRFGHERKTGNKNEQLLLDATIKDVKRIIGENVDYFNDLKNCGIDTIKIMGVSYSDVDFPYFQEIRKKLPNAKWEFGYHTEDDRNRANEYLRKLNLNANAEIKPSNSMFERVSQSQKRMTFFRKRCEN